MKTYLVMYAEDVPHYGYFKIKAANHSEAIGAAVGYDLTQVTLRPDHRFRRRIVEITDEHGKVIADNVRLHDSCDMARPLARTLRG